MAIRLSIPSRKRKADDKDRELYALQEQADGRQLSDDAIALRLQEECAALTLQYRCRTDFGCDPGLGFWVQLATWPLPDNMADAACELIVLIPRDFPAAPPATVFMPAGITLSGDIPVHVLLPADYNGPTPESWQACGVPSFRWRAGDDVDRAFSILYTALESAVRMSLTLSSVGNVLSSGHCTETRPDDMEATQ